MNPIMSPQSDIYCPNCSYSLQRWLSDHPGQGEFDCPSCRKKVKLTLYPAFFFSPENESTGEKLLDDTEAACFYHEGKKAEIACDHCGRFLCGLCDIEIGNQHLCPSCLSNAPRDQEKTNVSERTRYDILLCYLAICPTIFWPVCFITAPLTLILSVFFWRKPRSMSGFNGLYRWIAMGVALLQISIILLTFISFNSTMDYYG